MSTPSGLMNRIPDMKQLPALREPFDIHMTHTHDSVQGYMAKRLGDTTAGSPHKLTWNFYEPRKRWEAVCEHSDVLFYAAAVPEDTGFRTYRTLHK